MQRVLEIEISNLASNTYKKRKITENWLFNDLRRYTYKIRCKNTPKNVRLWGVDSRAKIVHCYQQCSFAAKIAALHFFLDKCAQKSAWLIAMQSSENR